MSTSIAHVRHGVGRWLGRMIERPRIRGSWLERVILWGEREYYNIGSDLASSGELAVLRRFGARQPAVLVVDVGANIGAYSMAVLELLPGASVVAFELDPALHGVLQERLRRFAGRATLMPFGLSDRDAEVEVRVFDLSNEVTSLAPLPRPGSSHLVRADVRDAARELAAIAAGHGRIDLLKLDTEGHDLVILQRALADPAAPRIEAIQFEFGQVCIPGRVMLADFYALLEADYVIGRVYRSGVDFKPFDVFRDERYVMGNYLAVRRDNPALVAALRAPRAEHR
jgi:FkbM family methyltransferase